MNTLILPIVVVVLVGWLVIDAFIICRLMNKINDMGNLEMLVFSLESDNRYLREANEKLIDEDMRKSKLETSTDEEALAYGRAWSEHEANILRIENADLRKSNLGAEAQRNALCDKALGPIPNVYPSQRLSRSQRDI